MQLFCNQIFQYSSRLYISYTILFFSNESGLERNFYRFSEEITESGQRRGSHNEFHGRHQDGAIRKNQGSD